MNTLLLLPLLLLACSGGGLVIDPGPEEPAPYIDPAVSQAVPALDATAVQIALDEVFAVIWDFQAQPVLDAYDRVNAHADTDCPRIYPDYDSDFGDAWYWFEACTSEAGADYSGFVYGVDFDGLASDGLVFSGGGMFAAGEVTDPQGRRWEGNGTVYSYTAADVAETYHLSALVMAGTWSWDGDDGQSWMSTGLEPDFTASASWFSALGAGAVGFDGGLFGLSGAMDTVVMDGVVLYDEALAPSCSLEPSGTISVRDVAGNWFDVVYDGPEALEDPVNADWCDGCGGAWYRGDPVGEICLDFSALLDWEVTPW